MEHSKHCYEFTGMNNFSTSFSSASSQSSFLSFRFQKQSENKLPYKRRFALCCRKAECEHFYKNYTNKVLVSFKFLLGSKKISVLILFNNQKLSSNSLKNFGYLSEKSTKSLLSYPLKYACKNIRKPFSAFFQQATFF